MPRPPKHAQITLGAYTVPLIGVPPDATREECDTCRKSFPLQKISITFTGMCVCEKCAKKIPGD